MDISICRIEESPFSYEELMNMIHSSVKERLEKNIVFNVTKMTADDFRNKNKDGIVLVAFSNCELLGTVCIHIYTNKEGRKYAYHEHIFVNPEYKRSGIGTMLLRMHIETAIANDCDYILSDTAVKAKSSIKWHLKNGFWKYEWYSFKSTNYYSIVFRKQLVPDSKWSNPRYCKYHYWKSAIQCRMYHLPNGEDRKSKWLDLYKKLRGIPS